MNRLAATSLLAALCAAPAAAQPMDHAMHGMSMAPAVKPNAPVQPKAASQDSAPEEPHAGHRMASTPGMDMPAPPPQPEPAIPETPPPPPPSDHIADRFYDPAAMAEARRVLSMEHGGALFSKAMANLAEYQAGSQHGGGYRWDGEAWFGGDINRLVAKSEGEGGGRKGVRSAELQALYSRAVSRYFDLQAGVRQDFSPRARTYLTVGTEGLFPYWFEVDGALFLSTQGELLGRAEGTYDLRLTQRLILQPRVELNLAAQDTAETRTGSGLSQAELGLRLRYEIRRELAPYVGVSYERRFGRTADFARAAGEDSHATRFVVGVRAWF